MSEKNNDRFNLDFHSLFSDLMKSMWAIVLGALAITLVADLHMTYFTPKTYTTKATFVVTSKSYSSYTYNNLSAAQSMAATLQNILNSDILKKEVCKDLGMESFNASVRASVIDETNLLELYVTGKTPLLTFRLVNSIMNNYQNLTQYVNSDAVMQVLEEPYVPVTPSSGVRSWSRLRNIFGISFAGLVLLFLYMSYRNDTIKSEEDLSDKLDAKPLGAIRHEHTGLFAGNRKAPLVNDVDASFGFTEQHKKVASRIVTAANEHGARSIMITSVREHEGKSNVAANLALTLAKQKYSVMLIDLDLRRPVQYQLFGIQEVSDLPNVIHNKELLNKAIIRKDGVSLLLTKGQYDNSTEIIADRSMANLISAAKRVYDFVIIDTPPIGAMSDAEAVADFTDMSVMVVQYNNVQAKDINDAIDELNKGRAYFAGVILNGLWESQGRGSVLGGYGAYGTYGRYGRYGKYGKYGHYAERKMTGSSGVKA